MASVLSGSCSSSVSPVSATSFHTLCPASSRRRFIREGSSLRNNAPVQAQFRLDALALAASQAQGEVSAESRNAEHTINGKREKRKRSTSMDQENELPPRQRAAMDREDWDEIQEYGQFLRETVNAAIPDVFVSAEERRKASPSASTERTHRTREEKYITPFDSLSWRNLHFHSELKHLAPLTSQENRIHAKQSSKLSNWITDPINDSMFRGWNGLGQVVYPGPQSEEEQRQQASAQLEAIRGILEEENESEVEEPPPTGEPALPLNPDEGIPTPNTTSAGQTSFARYLSQEAPSSSKDTLLPPPGVTSLQTSRSSSMRSSDEDTKSIVSQDNHWRRTILG